jgi:hypothetical protein
MIPDKFSLGLFDHFTMPEQGGEVVFLGREYLSYRANDRRIT